MKSFVIWLTTFAALGALLAMIFHPSPIEILIVWAVINGLYYGLRSYRRPISSAAG